MTSPRIVSAFVSTAARAGEPQALCARVRDVLAKAGRDGRATIVMPGEELRRGIAQEMERGNTVVVGGGDGSINCAAGVMAGSDQPLGILPFGTFNHFARDAGLPLDLEGALGAVLAGATRSVDVAEVNGRVFVNNSSVGLYPRIVRLRESYRARGSRKWIAFSWATLKAVTQQSRVVVRLTVDEREHLHRTSLVLVGNNAYQMKGLDAASRASLTDGILAVYVVKARGPGQLARLFWAALRGHPSEGELLDVLHASEATIEVRHSPVSVAIDGEVQVMDMPLEYRIRPRALRIFVPLTSAATQ